MLALLNDFAHGRGWAGVSDDPAPIGLWFPKYFPGQARVTIATGAFGGVTIVNRAPRVSSR